MSLKDMNDEMIWHDSTWFDMIQHDLTWMTWFDINDIFNPNTKMV
jgi:hypothetical protein